MMKLSKWRLTVLAVTAEYSILVCLVEIGEVVAFRNHWRIHYWRTPDFWVPFDFLLFPFNLTQEVSWFWGTFAAFYWPLASIAGTVLFWSLLTWPVEAVVRRVRRGQSTGASGLATWEELAGLLTATAVFVLLCYFMIKAYPFK